MSDAKPDISVVIPTYNRCHFLGDAIESCFDGNEEVDVEVVVVDDGSTDGTKEFLQALSRNDERVRPFFHEHYGVQLARNRGLDEARGEFVKFLDDDDLLVKGILSQEVEVLRKTDAAFCHGNLAFFRGKRTQVEEEVATDHSSDFFVRLIRDKAEGWPPARTYRRSTIRDIRWDPQIPFKEDCDFLFYVMLGEPRYVSLDSIVCHMRRHGEQTTDRDSKFQSDPSYASRGRLHMLIKWQKSLEARGKMTDLRRQALLREIWRYAHNLMVYDLGEFRRGYSVVQSLDAEYVPLRGNALVTAMDHTFGPLSTEYAIYPMRRAKALMQIAKTKLPGRFIGLS